MTDPAQTPLLEWLQRLFPDSSKTTLRTMLQSDRVRVNGKPERDAKRPIAAADRVEVGGKTAKVPLDSRIAVIFKDDDLVAINKSTGLLTVPDSEGRSESVESLLNAHFGAKPGESRVHVVHRLDRDASGILVFARNGDMRDRLKALFATHEISRVYVAVIHGAMDPPSGTLRSYLTEDRELRVRSVANSADGKEAITHYKTIATGESYSMLEVTLETGRRNQIRVHLAESGYPIVGDTMYGQGLANPLGRLGLHARHLGFVHPRTKKRVEFEAPVPEEFRRLKL